MLWKSEGKGRTHKLHKILLLSPYGDWIDTAETKNVKFLRGHRVRKWWKTVHTYCFLTGDKGVKWLLTTGVKKSPIFPCKEHPKKQAVMRLSGLAKSGDLQICRTNVLTGDDKCKSRIWPYLVSTGTARGLIVHRPRAETGENQDKEEIRLGDILLYEVLGGIGEQFESWDTSRIWDNTKPRYPISRNT